MSTAAIVIIAILGVGVAVLGILLYRSKTDYQSLLAFKDAAFATQVKNSEIMMKDSIYFEGREQGIMIMALTAPQVKQRISEPKTKRIDREAYKTLLKKMKESIK